MIQKNYKFPDRVFITGTDTGVGKTVISAILMAGLRGIYWKPVQSGLDDVTDREWVQEKTGLTDTHFRVEAYKLSLPISPHASAKHDGVRIDLEKILIPEVKAPQHLIIEGAGGIMVPLNEGCLMRDLMKKTDSQILLVARTSLGTINHTLLSLAELERQGLRVMGVVMNGPKDRVSKQAIEYYGKVRVLAETEPIADINPVSLMAMFDKYFKSFIEG